MATTRSSGSPTRPTSDVPGGWHAEYLATGELRLRLYGEWGLSNGVQSIVEISRRLSSPPRPSRISFESSELGAWDNVLINFLSRLEAAAVELGIAVDSSGLPGGVQRLVALARAVPERQGARRTMQRADLLTRIGANYLSFLTEAGDLITFFGEALIGIGRMLVGRARLRRSDLMVAIEDCGPNALPITALISFLVGLILAFVGAIQLKQFGAAIFVANLVGIAMVREMGAMMTAILMSGRTGAAFAANLGTMQVSDEVSALQTLGIPPMEFLVTPRVVALCLMMPLLTVFANIFGMLGGMLIASLMLDIPAVSYYNQTSGAVGLNDWAVGLVKAVLFGAVVAIVGCWRGMRCQRSAAAVGSAATSAVVLCIVLIISIDAIATVICTTLKI